MSLLQYARRYLASGFSVIPCRHKKPDLKSWREYTARRPSLFEVNRFFNPEFAKDDQSIGLVLGNVSRNVVVVDCDGIKAISAFYSRFPELQYTFSVKSGSGVGMHFYYYVQDIMPANLNVRFDDVGIEIRGNGQYVIAPPSPHESGKFYTVNRMRPIKRLSNLENVIMWLEKLRGNEQADRQEEITQAARPVPVPTISRKEAFLSKVLSEELARVQTSGYGNRNNSLFYASLRLANFAAGNELSWSDCEARLLAAAKSVGVDESEAKRTIASAWRIGSKSPKKVK